MIKTVIVTIHGQESKGKNMALLSTELSKEKVLTDCAFINIKYTRLLTVVNTLPWVRTMTAKYVASRLETIKYMYPGARVIVLAHSNGTRASRIAMDMRLRPKKKWPKFKIDNLILLGCPIKRNYKWTKHLKTKVVNFISSNDRVVWLARFYGMGAAGRYGFKYEGSNLTQIRVKWGHSGFMKEYNLISSVVLNILLTEGK